MDKYLKYFLSFKEMHKKGFKFDEISQNKYCFCSLIGLFLSKVLLKLIYNLLGLK